MRVSFHLVYWNSKMRARLPRYMLLGKRRYSGVSRICKRGARSSAAGASIYSAEGAEECGVWGGGFSLPTAEEEVSPPQKMFLTLDLKMSTSSAL